MAGIERISNTIEQSNEDRIKEMNLYLSKDLNQNSEKQLDYHILVESVSDTQIKLKITQDNTISDYELFFNINWSKEDIQKITDKDINNILKNELNSFFDNEWDLKEETIIYTLSYPISKEVMFSSAWIAVIEQTKDWVKDTKVEITKQKIEEARDKINEYKSKTFSDLVELYNNPKKWDEKVVILSSIHDKIKENWYIIDFNNWAFALNKLIAWWEELDLKIFDKLSRETKEQLLVSWLIKSVWSKSKNYMEFASQIIIDKWLNPTENPNWKLNDLNTANLQKLKELINTKKEESKENIQILQELYFLEDYISKKNSFNDVNIWELKLQREVSSTFSNFASSAEWANVRQEYERLTWQKVDNRAFSEKLASWDIFKEFLNSWGGTALLIFWIIGSIFKIDGAKYALFSWLGMFVGKDVLNVLDKNWALDGVKQNLDASISGNPARQEQRNTLPEWIEYKFQKAYNKIKQENTWKMNKNETHIKDDRFDKIFSVLSKNETFKQQALTGTEITADKMQTVLWSSNIDINWKPLTVEELNLFVSMLKNNKESGLNETKIWDLFIEWTIETPSLTTPDWIAVAAWVVATTVSWYAQELYSTVQDFFKDIKNWEVNTFEWLSVKVSTEISNLLENITDENKRNILVNSIKQKTITTIDEASFDHNQVETFKAIKKIINESETLNSLHAKYEEAKKYIKEKSEESWFTDKLNEYKKYFNDNTSLIWTALKADYETIKGKFDIMISTAKEKEDKIASLKTKIAELKTKITINKINSMTKDNVNEIKTDIETLNKSIASLKNLDVARTESFDESIKTAFETKLKEVTLVSMDNTLISIINWIKDSSLKTEIQKNINILKLEEATEIDDIQSWEIYYNDLKKINDYIKQTYNIN